MRPNRLLRVNGAFLMFMGAAAAVADAAGHFFGKGPFGEVGFRNTLSISSFEAHLLAAVIGALLWRAARRSDRGAFHLLAALVHTILGGSNLLFFEDTFVAMGLQVFGVAVTVVHFAFVITQSIAAARLPRSSASAADSTPADLRLERGTQS